MAVNGIRHQTTLQSFLYSVLLVCFRIWKIFPQPFYNVVIHGDVELSWIRTSHVQGLVWCSVFFSMYHGTNQKHFILLSFLQSTRWCSVYFPFNSKGKWKRMRTKCEKTRVCVYISPYVYWITESSSGAFFNICWHHNLSVLFNVTSSTNESRNRRDRVCVMEGGKGKARCEMNIVSDCQVCACATTRGAAEAPVPVSVAHTSPQGAGRAPSTQNHTF